MKLTPKSEVEIDIETGSAFGHGDKKAKFSIYEQPDGAVSIIGEDGKTLKVETTDQNRIVVIHSV